MNIAPGHIEIPRYKITTKRPHIRVQVFAGGEKIADSLDVIKVSESEGPARYYLPRSDVRMDLLIASNTHSDNPFKGHASYFDIQLGDKLIKDAGWCYSRVYDDHRELKNRIAFYPDKVDEIRLLDLSGNEIAS